MLEPFRLGRVTGLVIEGVLSGVHLTWDSYPGALCYSIYKAVDELDPYGAYTVVAECTENTDIILGFPEGTFRVTAITNEGETDYSDFVTYSFAPPPPPVDPCAVLPWEELGPPPTSFGVEETFYTLNIPAPSAHLDFDDPYTVNVVNIPDPWPDGDGWDIDIDYVSGDWKANDGSLIYSGFGLQSFRNNAERGMRMAVCSFIGYNQATIQALLGIESFFFLETALAAGETYGIGINLRNISWVNGQLGSFDPVDPYYDPSQHCGSCRFDGANSSTISSNLVLRARIYRDTTPAITQVKVRNLNHVKANLTAPPAIHPGFWGPNTYAFSTRPGNEWNGIFACSVSWALGWIMNPDGCMAVPTDINLNLNGYEVDNSNIQVEWSAQYVDVNDVLHLTPAWILTIYCQDTNWNADFMWWTGVKLRGTTPLGTYLVWPRYAYNLIMGGRKWMNPDQTYLFGADLPCIQLEHV